VSGSGTCVRALIADGCHEHALFVYPGTRSAGVGDFRRQACARQWKRADVGALRNKRQPFTYLKTHPGVMNAAAVAASPRLGELRRSFACRAAL